MLHRSEDLENGIDGICPDFLRQALSYLRKSGYVFISLTEIVARSNGERGPIEHAIAFTIDDGYADQASKLLPIFAENECPVTVFLITGFVDGQLWPWDDQVRYIFEETDKASIEVNIAGECYSFQLDAGTDRVLARRRIQSIFKEISEKDLIESLAMLAKNADVELPDNPPERYKPMTWEAARVWESKEIEFAPHTVSHRILSRMSPDRSRAEIEISWERLNQELKSPVPIFAYPNGNLVDFSDREIGTLVDLKFKGGVSAQPVIANANLKNTNPFSRFQFGRIGMPTNHFDLIQYAGWISRLKWIVQRTGYAEKFGGRKSFINIIRAKMYLKFGYLSRYRNINWQQVERLVFVGDGNLCRSPYAEKKALSCQMLSSSIGISANSGASVNKTASLMARLRGQDISDHVARRIGDIGIRPGDLLLCMEPIQCRKLRKLTHSENIQFTLLGLWSTQSRPIIPDPYGCPVVFFERCFGWIDDAIESIARTRMLK